MPNLGLKCHFWVSFSKIVSHISYNHGSLDFPTLWATTLWVYEGFSQGWLWWSIWTVHQKISWFDISHQNYSKKYRLSNTWFFYSIFLFILIVFWATIQYRYRIESHGTIQYRIVIVFFAIGHYSEYSLWKKIAF